MENKKIEKEFKEFLKKYENYQFNYQYLLELEIKYYSGDRYYDDIVDEFNYSNLYSNMENAKQEGIWYINNRFESLLIDNGNWKRSYKFKAKDGEKTTDEFGKTLEENIEDLINDGTLYYSFTITKIDSKYKDEFVNPYNEEMLIGVEPPKVIYDFDYKGKERYHTIEYTDLEGGIGYDAFLYKGDTDEGAGLKFHFGDLVKDEQNRIFMIICHWSNIMPHDRRELWMNKYWGVMICEDGSMNDYYDDLFEAHLELVKRAEDVIKESKNGNEEMKPWAFMQELFKYYNNINDENWEKFRSSEISFKSQRSWRDITFEDILKL